MAGYWLKLYTEILDDPKYYRLSDNAKLGMYELMMVAKKVGQDGHLPSVDDIEFYTRRTVSWWQPVIDELKAINFITDNTTGLVIRKFEERQAAIPSDEKQRKYREAQHKKDYSGYEPVTDALRKVTESKSKSKSTEIEKEEKKNTGFAPQFFNTGWHEQVFIMATGISGIPRGDAPKVYEALDAMRKRFTTESEMVDYLKPYYEAWTSKRTKDGRHFSKSNCAWLYDWALAGDTITAPKLDRVMEVHHAPKYDPDCELCHGKGKYMSEKVGRFVACDCEKVYAEVEA